MNEGTAIANAYGSSDRPNYLRVSSSRSNLGHMEAASFTLSLLKVLMMFKNRTFLPVSSHFKSPNPKIPFEAKRMRVQTEAEPFPDREHPVTVGINSFGFGGANGHCVLQEYKDTRAWSKLPGDLPGKVFTFPVTAKSEEALIENVRRLNDKLESFEAEFSVYDLAANLTQRMTHFRYRAAFVASTFAELKEKLEGFLASAEKEELAKDKLVDSLAEASANESDPVAIVFPGQGSQWAGCGKELYETEIVFRRVVDAVDAEFIKLAGCKLSDVAFDPEAGSKINDCEWAQPITFMLQAALYEMLRVQGVRACCVVGHSAGEAGAAYASGAYTLEEACYIVYHRAKLQQGLSGCGRMFVLMMGKKDVEDKLAEFGLADKTYIACINAPANTVICGPEEVIMEFKEKLSAEGINGKLIPGNIAFHSPLMMPIEKPVLEIMGKLDGEERSSKIPYVSTVTGGVFNDFSAQYWWENVRQPVNYLDAMKAMRTRFKPKFILELAPHITLRSPTRDCYAESGEPMPPYVYSLVRNTNTATQFADFLGRCFRAGTPIDYSRIFPLPKPMTHSLPKYYLKEERVIDDLMDDHALLPAGPHLHGPMLGRRSQADRLQFESIYSIDHYGWVADHVVQGSPIIPAAGYVELVLEAFKGSPVKFISARFLSPFILSQQNYYIHTNITPVEHTANRFEFRIVSREHSFEADSTLHCTGVVEKLSSEIPLRAVPSSVPHTLAAVDTQNFTEHLYDGPDYYDTTVARLEGFNYGPLFQALQVMHKDVNSDRIMAHMAMDETRWEHSEKMGFVMHPCLLDGALQIFIKFFLDTPDFTGIPQMLNDLVVVQKPTAGQITCIFEPPAESPAIYEKGQFLGPGLGERSVGSIAMYDTVTGELVAYLGTYKTYNSNTRKGDRVNLNHSLSWQPKDDLAISKLGVADIPKICVEKGVAQAVLKLINDINKKSHPESESKVPYFLNAGECVVGDAPIATFMEYIAGKISVSPVQYTICGNNTEYLRSIYDKVGASSLEANLRFASTEAEDFESGMIRKQMFELLSLRCAISEWDEEMESECNRVTQLVAPEGLLLAEMPVDVAFAPEGFTALWSTEITTGEGEDAKSSNVTLFQAPALKPAKPAEFADKACCVVDDSKGFSAHWREMNKIPAGESKETDFSTAKTWENVFYFALDGSEEDLSYESATLTEFCKKFSNQRNGAEGIPQCTFTVFTTGGARVVTAPTQSSIWGAVRSIAMEIGDGCNVDFRVVDLAAKEDLRYVLSIENMREREMCIHNGKVWSPRLISRKEFQKMMTMSEKSEQPYKLHTDYSGIISDLQFVTHEPGDLGDNEVEISVEGAAINFRDIMVALGRLPLQSYERSALGRNLGMECSGVISKVGKNVTLCKLGDEVIAMKAGCIANRVICNEHTVVPKPSNISFQEASSILSVYVTAYYSLIHLGRMREGQSMLVHSAMGGVGQAAIALAKLKGAKIYATGGTPEKRAKLQAMGCAGVFNSRSTDWFENLMEATNGEGVDLCLNSLAGEHIDLCLEALRAGGAHFEIGKVDIYADRPMKMAVFRKNLTFRGVDIDRLMMDDGPLVRQLTLEVLELIGTSKVPTLPITEFKYADYFDALRIMMKGEHQGKMVLTPPKGEETVEVVDNRPIYGPNENGKDSTIFITGGFGGFGLLLLRYLISMGARNIMMVDRDEELRRDEAWLMKQAKLVDVLGDESIPLRIESVYANMPVKEEVFNAVAEVEKRGMPPIGTVFHLAGVLDDKMLGDLDRESFTKVFKPKVDGALHLHNATKGIKTIERYVMFSSISALMGNAGQINYAAANSYLDGLAQMRRAEGLPALAFNLGAVSVAGMAARNPQLLRMMKANGTPAISGVFAIDAIDFALRSCPYSNTLAALTSGIFPADLDSSDFLRAQAQLVHNGSAFKLGRSSAFSKVGIASLLAIKVADLCGVEEVDTTEPFATYGLNSISVAELLAFIKNEMSFTGVGAIELMTTASCDSIAEKIVAAQEDKSGDGDEDGNGDDAKAGEEVEEVEAVDLPLAESRFLPKIEEYFPEGRKIVLPVKKSSAAKEAFTPAPVAAAQNSEIEDMISSLPHIVRETVDELTGFIGGLATDGAKPVPVQDIKRVVLTGATGFCGRHFIKDLLNDSPIPLEMIYCPVRAGSDEEAMDRLKKSMEEAGTWDESFKDRLSVFAADLSQVAFGNQEKFDEILEKADAVYHFAASISLSASYNAIREINCAPMREVFRLCAEKKKKHFWMASTLGIFPQYFCMFSDDMAETPISRNALPDIQLMKRVFPISLAGYPWSKLVNEIATMEFARVLEVPYALFRLPLMCMNSDTGFTVANDPFVRLLVAVLQTGTTPASDAGLPSADSAFANRAMLKLSMNPARKNDIFHCWDILPAPLTKAPALSMLGFGVKNVQYHEFKEACQAHGSASPLKDYWLLLDLFSSYWFDFKKRAAAPLIDTSTLQEDSDMNTEDIDALGTLESGLKWTNANKEIWPFPTALGYDLTLDKVLQPAKELCEMYDVPFDAAVPTHVVDAIKKILSETNAPAHKTPSLAFYMTNKLESRVHMYRMLEKYPEIKEEKVEKPVFILGLNRTGSTFLHRMMVSSGNFSAPFLEEQVAVPPLEEIGQANYSKESRDQFAMEMYRDYFKIAEGVHEMALGIPEEDMAAHAHSFMTLEYDIAHSLPEYRNWLNTQSFDEVYAEHKTWMQYISWMRKKEGGSVADRWCFKLPWHARNLGSLLKTYPDATIIHTHRDLKSVTGSWCALIQAVRDDVNDYNIDKTSVGPEQLVVLRETLDASSTFRKENEVESARFLDVNFDELVESPLEIASKALTHVGIEPDMDMMTELGDFLQIAAEKRDAMAKRTYDLKDYGLEDKDF